MFSELIVLLPCHSLEDFPVHHEGAEAEGLLSAWSALWHPALIAAAGNLPSWFRADAPPDDLDGRLIIVPQASESLLLTGWTTTAKDGGALVLRKTQKRDDLVAAAFAGVEPAPTGDESLVGDFFALGTAFLLVELLTRQMRYMSNLDEVQLKRATVDAAKAWTAGDNDTVRRHLTAAFEVITEARERFYPVNCYLIDLTLVAGTTLGSTLKRELEAAVPTNLLISGTIVEECASKEPATLEAIRAALEQKRVAIVGGEQTEEALPFVPREAVLDNFVRGIATYQRVLGQRPIVFGRRRYGLSPILPSVLSRSGFEAALHFTLDDGQFPHGSQAKTRWEGLDSSAVDALCRVPLDAAASETILNFPRTMGDSMDSDHVATVVFARWPGQSTTHYDDLRRMSAYGSPLGKFITLDEYFQFTDSPGEMTRFQPDRYRAPYLQQAIIKQQPDAISQFCQLEEQSQQSRAIGALTAMADAVTGTVCDENATLGSATARLAEATCGRSSTGAKGVFVANAASSPRRVLVDVSKLANLPAVEGPVAAVQESAQGRWALADVPGCGFAWIASGPAAAAGRPAAKKSKPMAEETFLRNEHFEVSVHPINGGIKGIHCVNARGNRLSQQLSFRLPARRPEPGSLWRDPDESAEYSVMAVDAIEVTSPGPAFGEIVSRGRLMSPEGKRLAGFTQTLRLLRGSKLLEMGVELEIDEQPRADPWNSYYASRIAWGDETAELWRSVGSTSQQTTAKRLEAPQFVEIRSPAWTTTLLTGGCPYHRHTTDRMLDTLLVVRGETRRSFRLGLLIDDNHTAQAACAFATEPAVAENIAIPGAANGSGWLFHLDTRNVVATHWQGVVEDGRTRGIRIRLLETEGRPGRVSLRTFKSPVAARQIDFLGQTLTELPIESDRVGIDFAAYEWNEVEVMFEK